MAGPAWAASGSADSDSENAAVATFQEPEHGHHSSEISDEYIPLQLEGFPSGPKFLLELGNPYLGTGNIRPGFQLPTGAVWQPTLILFGTLRSAVQSFEVDDFRVTEWANRLDLFANLQLSGTERLVVGFRNFDRDGSFTSYIFEPSSDDPAFQALFGDTDAVPRRAERRDRDALLRRRLRRDLPEPRPKDFSRTDVGFSIGRQPLRFKKAC